MKNVLAMILAGGRGTRLNILAHKRAKPAVPFGGNYRIIDFSLSNLMNSGIQKAGVLTQYKPGSLTDHIGNGSSWDLFGITRAVKILPPFSKLESSDWYRGTADAVFQNIEFIERFNPKEVLILSGDHIYNMDYSELVYYHRSKKSDFTLAVMEVDISEASRFGIALTNKNGEITAFEEKPEKPSGTLASMGIYVFNTDVLIDELRKTIKKGGVDFGKHLIPSMLGRRRMFAFPFSGYWRDVGTIKTYFETNMDVLNPSSGLDLEKWRVHTNIYYRHIDELPPAYFGKNSGVYGSLISRGCVIYGTVVNSILSPGVYIGKGATVRNSIVMHHTKILENCIVEKAIIDKSVIVGKGSMIGVGDKVNQNSLYPKHLVEGITLIGKNVEIPENVVIEKHCIVFPDKKSWHFKKKVLKSGETLK